MTRRGIRQKASDVFRESNFLFAKKSPFAEAFPEIADIRIEVEIGHASGGNPTRVYTLNNLPGEYVDCNKSACYNGGFSIGDVLREMVRTRESDQNGSAICHGYEGSPKGRRKYRECLNFFRYKVHIDCRN
jgi:hypothetical protein